MTSTATTVGGWSLIVAFGGLAYWQYRSKNGQRAANNTRVGAAATAERQRGVSKDRRKKERPVDSVTKEPSPPAGGNEQVKNRKKKRREAPQSAISSSVDPKPATLNAMPTSGNEHDDESDDRAFARQLASAQTGTKLKAPERFADKVRTNKVKANKQGGDWQSSGTSSPVLGDADGAVSAGLSPPLAPTTSAQSLTGIEDMLEAPAPGPVTLRVTPSEKPQREPASRKAKPVVEEETKKQRQRRRRREAEKALVAEAEAERKRLLEKQLKTARTAEGTAKSGQYRTYTPPTSSVWTKAGADNVAPIAPVSNDGLLDTFEPDMSPVAPASGANITASAAPLDAPSDGSHASIDSEPASADSSIVAGHPEPVIADASEVSVSGNRMDAWEDYQIRTIEQREKGNDGWTEVPAKGKKKAAN